MTDHDGGAHAEDADAPGTAAPGGISRRGILGLLGAGALGGALVGSAGGVMADRAFAGARQAAGGSTYAFHGAHQAGITTPAQDRLHFAAFDVADIDRAGLVSLLQDWSAAGRRSAMPKRSTPAAVVKSDGPSPKVMVRPAGGRSSASPVSSGGES
jgi:deferrochelatase/peroxidase EfeB